MPSATSKTDTAKPSSRRKWAFRVGFLIFAALEIFVVAELFYRYLASPGQFYLPPEVLRASHPHAHLFVKSETPGLDYEMAPNLSVSVPIPGAAPMEIVTNSFGMRDREPLPLERDDVFRVAVLGDSITFGWGVADGNLVYPNVLEDELNRASAGAAVFDVLNFGVNGYSAEHEAAVLRHKALQWNPDIVIIGYFLNDPELEKFDPLRRMFLEAKWWQYLASGRALLWNLYQLRMTSSGAGSYYGFLHTDGTPEWRSVLDAFAEIREMTKPRQIPVVVAVFPEIPLGDSIEDWSGYLYRDLHRKVAAAAEQAGFRAMDLIEPLSRRSPDSLRFLTDDPHPTAEGHRLAACAILEGIADLLPPDAFTGGPAACDPAP